MDIEKSRSGFYTVTFFNKNNLEEEFIVKEFSSVGNVCKVVQNFQRVFIRFKEKNEAERAIKKFGKLYELEMARNKSENPKPTENHQEGINNFNHNQKSSNNSIVDLSSSEPSSLVQSMEILDTPSNFCHLVLGNLPKNYTLNDVKALVEEAKPVWINPLEETRVFNLRFCHIVLSSAEDMNYLIDKLNGFVISGEKLIAAESKHLLEWRGKAV